MLTRTLDRQMRNFLGSTRKVRGSFLFFRFSGQRGLLLQMFGERFSSVGLFVLGDLFGSAGRYDLSAPGTAFWPQIDNPICSLPKSTRLCRTCRSSAMSAK